MRKLPRSFFYPLVNLCILVSSLCCLGAFTHLSASVGRQITLTIKDIDSPTFRARGIHAQLSGEDLSVLSMEISKLQVFGKTFLHVRLSCRKLNLQAERVDCERGELELNQKLPIRFGYSSKDKNFRLESVISADENWVINGRLLDKGIDVVLTVKNGHINRFVSLLPNSLPRVSDGIIDGSVKLASGRDPKIDLDLRLAQFGFSDAAGLHAGEKIGGQLLIQASKYGEHWQWQGAIDWAQGEAFWQPLYFTGGLKLAATGTADEKKFEIAHAKLSAEDVGEVEFNGVLDRDNNKLLKASARAPQCNLGPLHQKILKPFLQGTQLADLQTTGVLNFDLLYDNSAIQSLNLTLNNFSIEDNKNKRFALFGVDAVIPWKNVGATHASISVKGGEFLHIPFGSFRAPIHMEGLSFGIEQLQLPLLDGKLSLSDFLAKKVDSEWEWQFRGELTPVSVEKLSQDLGLPTMYGELSASIPRVSYSRSTLNVDGALLFNMFDGQLEVKHLRLFDPLSSASHLTGDIEMRNLDLDLLTRTFSFGSVTGKVDASVDNLELVNWQPVKFDAKIKSSEGKYPRRISQSAVGHISALGGAGATAAIQRSFLRVFKTFGYAEIGLSCHLRNGVCQMSGIENAQNGGYVIVKGGGVPELNVFGYNRNVNWGELLNRIKRITKGEVKPIIK